MLTADMWCTDGQPGSALADVVQISGQGISHMYLLLDFSSFHVIRCTNHSISCTRLVLYINYKMA